MATSQYLPDRGGTAIHTHELASRLVRAGLDVTVFTTTFDGGNVGASSEDGIRVERVRAWPRDTDYYFAPHLARLLSADDFDLVHCQGYHTLVAPMVMLTAMRRRQRFVVTFHSGGHSSSFRRALRPIQVQLLRPLLRRAAALIAVSEFEADLFARRLGLPRSALAVIPSGVELPSADFEPVAAEPLIVSVGRVESYKGHHRVIEALPLVREARPDMRVRIVGSGPYEPQLRKLAASLGLSDAVEIAPVPTHERTELAGLLRRAAVVTLLSEYESQGLAAYEALALGRPLVVSDSTALAELAGRPNVRAVSPAASASAVAHAVLEIAGAVPAVPEAFPTWPECVAGVLEVYDSVLRD
jgi:glycosyltransferase involved in cell wall biosynthesis